MTETFFFNQNLHDPGMFVTFLGRKYDTMGTKDGVPTRAEALFREYVALGPDRSLLKLAVHLGKSASYKRRLEEMSSRYNWQARVKLEDARIAEEHRKAREATEAEKRRVREEALNKMNEEHALLGRTQSLRAVKQIQELIDAKKLGSQATVALFKVATDLERIARGAETENVKVTRQEQHNANVLAIDLTKLTADQLERLEALADEIEE